MANIPLPRHQEAQMRRRLQPDYKSRRKCSDPSDTLPDAAARSNEAFDYLYQGGKWVPEDNGSFDRYASKDYAFD